MASFMGPGWLQALSALGYAGKGYNEGQDTAARRALLLQEQQKQQRILQAERIAALYRQSNAPLANVNQAPGIAGLAGLAGGGQPPQAQPQSPMPTPGPSGAGLPYQGGVYQPEQDPTLVGSAGAAPSGQPIRMGAPAAGEPIPLDTPDSSGGVPQSQERTTEPYASVTPDAQTGNQSGELMMTPPGGSPIPVSQLLGQRQSFSTILDTIAANAPPGTDPAIIYEAAGMVHKNVTQDNRDPMSLAILKMAFPTANFTMAEAGRNQRFGVSSGQRQQQINQSGQRVDQGNRRLDQGDRRLGQGDRRLNQQEFQQAYQRATGQTKMQLGELHRQLGDLDRQISQEINQGKTPGMELLKKRNAIAEKERALAQSSGVVPSDAQPDD